MEHSDLRIYHWNRVGSPEFGFMNAFDESLANLELKYPGLLPNLRQGSTIFVGSDYGGEHKSSRYESLAFLFADLEHCGPWERRRRQLRQRFLSDGRRLSYKALGDAKRKRVLMLFLNAANSIPGLVVNVLVDKHIQSLFRKEGRIDTNDPNITTRLHSVDGSRALSRRLR